MATKPKTKKTSTKKVAKTPPKEGFLKASKAKVCTYRKEKPAYFILIILVVIAFLIFAWWIVVVVYQKHQLNQAENTLFAIAEEIVYTQGEPELFENTNYCTYRSEKIRTALETPTCYVTFTGTTDLFSTDTLISKADQVTEAIRAYYDNKINVTVLRNGSTYSDLSKTLKYGLTVNFEEPTLKGIDCSAIIYNSPENGKVLISCSQDSRWQFFPEQ